MGNSSNSDHDYYGEWKDGKCKCEGGEKKVYNNSKVLTLYYETTHLTNMHAEIWSDFGRRLTLGITEFWFKWQPLVHGYVLAEIKCSNCKENKYVTFEYGNYGKRWRIGNYNKVYRTYNHYKPSNMNIKYILDKFDKMEGFNSEDYNFRNNNCQHFAKELYKKIT